MKAKTLIIPVVISFLTINTALADVSTDKDVLASRGVGFITQEDFSARADKIPESIRRETLRNGNRLRDVLNALLLQSQLAEAARDAGFDQNKIVKDRMRLAADNELGLAWVENYVDSQPEADYEAMAKEYYSLNSEQMTSKPAINVSHILVSNEGRTKEEALEITAVIEAQLAEDPTQFDALVLEYSDDPSAPGNKGHFKSINQGDMVKPFEDVAFKLKEGEISGPVQTRFGFHIIRLDAHIPAAQMPYEEVREQLVESERTRHRDRIKNTYLTELSNLPVDMTEEALELMVRRQFGDDYKDIPEDL